MDGTVRRAELTGTDRVPLVRLWFNRHDTLKGGRRLLDAVRALPRAQFDGEAQCWVVSATGRDPDRLLQRWGFEIDLEAEDPSLAGVQSLGEVFDPLLRLSAKQPGVVLVRPRLAGFARTLELLGPGARWDKATQRFEVPVADLVDDDGDPLPGLVYGRGIVQEARRRLAEPKPPREAAVLASVTSMGDAPGAAAALVDAVGDVPDWFGLDLYGYQRTGAIAAAAGLAQLGDEPGLGKSTTLRTPIPTPGGWTTVGDIRVGDEVFARDGSVTRVIGLSPVHYKPVYELHLSDGQVIEASPDHEWLASDRRSRSRALTQKRGAGDAYQARRIERAGSVMALAREVPPGLGMTITEMSALCGVSASYIAGVIRDGRIPGEKTSGPCVKRTRRVVAPTNRNEYPLAEAVRVASGWSGAQVTDPRPRSVWGDAAAAASAVLGREATPAERKAVANRLAYYGVPSRPQTRTKDVSFLSGGGVTVYPADEVLSAVARRLQERGGQTPIMERIVTTAEIADTLHAGNGGRNWAIRLPEPVDLPERDLPIDPYVLGAWLGDGHCNSGEITSGVRGASVDPISGVTDQEHLVDRIVEAGFTVHRITQDPNRLCVLGLRTRLRELGLLRVKRIPVAYLRGSREQRLALLQGLMDTDGSITAEGAAEFCTTSPELAEGVAELLRSLGIKVHPSRHEHTYRYEGQVREAKARFRLRFTTDLPVFTLPRKLRRLPTELRSTQQWLYVTNVRIRRPEPMRCLLVEHPEHLYLTNGFVPTHNTRTALAAAAIRGVERLLVVSPPVMLSGWEREATLSRVAGVGGRLPGAEVVVITPRRKEPDLPRRGVVIVSDSLLASREALAKRIRLWAPDGLIVDEVHRLKTWDSARGRVVRAVAEAVGDGPRLAISGTPLFANPVELANTLAITGQLDPVFGGMGRFCAAFARQNKYKAWVARKRELPRLRSMLDQYVWVRRHKEDVLTDLPAKSRREMIVDVDLSGFRAAHREVTEVVEGWVEEFLSAHGRLPEAADIAEYARDSIGLTSQLRKAAGLAKVDAATEYIVDWVASNETTLDEQGRTVYDRPLVVWTHHRVVSTAMAEAVPDAVGGARVIMGGISKAEQASIVDDFQAGLVPVLVASITAAGVGITLTRSSDALFVETDWTPALVLQAEDRTHRVSQTRPVTLTTMVAPGTLDEQVQKVLAAKAKVLEPLLGEGQDVSVIDTDDEDELTAPAEIVFDIADRLVAKRRRSRLSRAA